MTISFVYALLSSLFAGLFSFFLKVAAEKDYNSSLVIMYSQIIAAFLAFCAWIWYGNAESFSFVFWLALGNAFFYFLAILTRVESLKYIDTTIYFPIYKTLGPIFILLITFFYFQESFTQMEFIGIVLGIIIPLLLINKMENKRQSNLQKGLLLLAFGAVMTTITASIGKVLQNNHLDVYLYLFLTVSLTAFFSFFSWQKSLKKRKNYPKKHIKRIAILGGLVYFGAIFFFTSALTGNLAIVFTINSFSILVPIILSVIIYKEHFDFRKGLAIFLTILSLIFLK